MFDNKILDAICRRYGFETYETLEKFLEEDEEALTYVLDVLFFRIADLVEDKLSEKFEKFVEERAERLGIPEKEEEEEEEDRE